MISSYSGFNNSLLIICIVSGTAFLLSIALSSYGIIKTIRATNKKIVGRKITPETLNHRDIAISFTNKGFRDLNMDNVNIGNSIRNDHIMTQVQIVGDM